MAVSAKVATAYVELVAQTASFKKAMGEAQGLVRETSAKMRADMTEAKGSIALLGEEVGVHMPRHLRTFVAGLPGVATAMSAAFNAVAVFALLNVVVETGRKVVEFAKKNEEAARKAREAWQDAFTPISDSNNKLELTKTKLENAIAKIEHKPENKIKEAIEEATVAADELGRHLDADIRKIADTLKGEQHGMASQIFLKQTGANAAAKIAEDVREKFNQIAAGTYKPAAGESSDPTAQRDAVLAHALTAAWAQLGPAQARLDTFHGNVPSSSSSAEAVRTLTELIAGLKALQTTSQLTQEIAKAQGIKTTLDAKAAAAAGESTSSSLERPNTSMFHTPFRDLARQLFAEQQADRQANAQADAERAAVVGAEALKIIQGNQTAGLLGTFQAAQPSLAYSPVSEMSKAADGARGALKDLAASFSDTAGMVRENLMRAIDGFNNLLVGIMSGDKRASFSQFGHALFQDASKSALQRGEGYLFSAFGGHKKADGYHMWVDNLGGGSASSTASAAGRGILGMLNDSNWFSSLFGGRLFGAGSIFGGGHALGGDVAAGVPIDVGEMGRERFVPSVPGRIIPHNQLGGAAIMNIDARGTDPALTRENFVRALHATRRQATADASRVIAERQMRTAH
jgi:Lambda phage tail tape-measure protein (Tape_meas_lam_C)